MVEKSPSKPATATPPARPAKLSFNEKRELDGLPERIAQLEAEQAALQARLADPATYRAAPDEVARLNTRLAELETLVEQAMARWEALESRAGG